MSKMTLYCSQMYHNLPDYDLHVWLRLVKKHWGEWCTILDMELSAVITQSNIIRYYINNYRNWGRISTRYWIHRRHTIPRPNGWAVECLLWIFLEKVDRIITASHCNFFQITQWIHKCIPLPQLKRKKVCIAQKSTWVVCPKLPTAHLHLLRQVLRADSRFAPSQWKSALLCDDVCHWLGASLESALGEDWTASVKAAHEASHHSFQ